MDKRDLTGAGRDAEARPAMAFERLDCYRLALEFQVFVAAISRQQRLGAAGGQLDRAAASIPLNIAEGVGRRTAREQAQLFAIARGSASECAAALDVLAARGRLSSEAHRKGRGSLTRIVQMLTKLIDRQSHSSGSGANPDPS